MPSRKVLVASAVGLALLAAASYFVAGTRAPAPRADFSQQERVIAGSPRDALEVRHLVLKGTNEEIGRALARLAQERYQVRPRPSQDPVRTRAQRRYFEKHFPILHERMRGVAAAFGHRPDDDAWDHSGLDFTDLRAGCSVVHLPPRLTATGAGVVSRDYDYSTGSLTFGPLPPGKLHPTARPYLLELHPDRGYASLAMVSYDLLNGVLDGMNSEGLTVALALDDELFSKYPLEPTLESAVGLGVVQTLRLLLDTCATADEAKEALLQTKQYYEFVPVHYLIADRFGRAFVWEYSHAHNKEFIIENPDRPLVMTNFSLNRRLDKGRPPSAERAKDVCRRYCLLTEQLAATAAPVSEDFLKRVHKQVDAELPPSADTSRPPVRTLWHALYHPDRRGVQISFYLRDEAVSGQPDKVKVVRSDYLEFRLPPSETGKAPAPEATPRQGDAPQGSDAPARPESAQQQALQELRLGGASARAQDGRVVVANLDKAPDLGALLPLLQRLPDLEQLSLANPKMDDAGMACLKDLPNLRVLNLRGSAIGDEGLKVLKTLPKLRILGVGQTNVTAAGLAHLNELTRLEYLSISGVPVTDAGLARLKSLTNLTGLNLASTRITDAGLGHLKGMSKLTKLNLTSTAVTEDGVAKAREFLPRWLTVLRDQP
jgi:Acyl-coenzyme A:6-aminopenicillanic acid acyl-transferase/Leucine Rich repeat